MLDSRALFCRKEVSEFINIDENPNDFEIWTVEEVIEEIKDQSTRIYLENLPFKLQIKHPSPNSIVHIKNFAKKTGDSIGLSDTDIKVMALGYQSIKNRNEIQYLNTAPPELTEFKPKWNKNKKTDKPQNDTKEENVQETETKLEEKPVENIEKVSETTTNKAKTDEDQANDGWIEVAEPKKKFKHKKKQINVKRDFYPEKFMRDLKANNESKTENAKSQPEPESQPDVQPNVEEADKEVEKDIEVINTNEDALNEKNTEDKVEPTPDSTPQVVDDSPLVEKVDDDNLAIDEENDSCDDEWITPDNIGNYLTATRHIDNLNVDLDDNSKRVTTRIVTSDFSMQNVLMMLGIPVVSLDGVQINRIKRFKNLCHGCKHINSDSNKKVCESWGWGKLSKVSVFANSDGKITYFKGKNIRAKNARKRQKVYSEDQVFKGQKEIIPLNGLKFTKNGGSVTVGKITNAIGFEGGRF